MSEVAVDDRRVVLTLPAHAEYFLLARMSASAVASRLDFGIDEIEDLKLAVDELCLLCSLGATERARMTLTYAAKGDAIEITCECTGLGDSGPSEELPVAGGLASDTLAKRILDGLVDSHDCVELPDGARRASLSKRRTRLESGG